MGSVKEGGEFALDAFDLLGLLSWFFLKKPSLMATGCFRLEAGTRSSL
jgi:hypothetical protein